VLVESPEDHIVPSGNPLPLCDDPFTLRTPRREGGFAAQVWVDEGCWVVGRFATQTEALVAARQFAATDPIVPHPSARRDECPENWFRRRSDRHAPSRPFVREVKGGAWQARPWLGKRGGSLNLGLFTLAENNHNRDEAEWSAARTSREFCKLWRGKATVGEIVAILQGRNLVRSDLVVPKRQARLKPPTEFGEKELACDRRQRDDRDRERRLYAGRSLLSVA